jgi:hypothetical protein
MLPKLIWDTLSQIDVSAHTERKQNLTYLSWAWAWGTMCKHFPNTSYYFTYETFPDGTVEYVCTVTVRHFGEEHCQTMWLPVMDHRNKAIQNPDAFARNTCKMRCLTKCLSMLGLGHYIYAGEDLPEGKEPEKINEQEQALLARLIEETGTDVERFYAAYRINSFQDLLKDRFDHALKRLEAKMEAQLNAGD